MKKMKLGLGFRRIISRCTSPIHQRYPSVNELRRDCENEKRRWHAWLWGSIAVVCLFVVYAVWNQTTTIRKDAIGPHGALRSQNASATDLQERLDDEAEEKSQTTTIRKDTISANGELRTLNASVTDLQKRLDAEGVHFSKAAQQELAVSRELLDRLLSATVKAFEDRDIASAEAIEPLEEVMDDMINALSDNHMQRLREGKCSVNAGTGLLDVLTHFSRIADTCSNVGVAVLTRVNPEIANRAHNYVTQLHLGHNDDYNKAYHAAHDVYFEKLGRAQQSALGEASEGQLSLQDIPGAPSGK